MTVPAPIPSTTRSRGLRALSAVVGLAVVASCAAPSSMSTGVMSSIAPTMAMAPLSVTPPSPDPRVVLEAGERRRQRLASVGVQRSHHGPHEPEAQRGARHPPRREQARVRGDQGAAHVQAPGQVFARDIEMDEDQIVAVPAEPLAIAALEGRAGHHAAAPARPPQSAITGALTEYVCLLAPGLPPTRGRSTTTFRRWWWRSPTARDQLAACPGQGRLTLPYGRRSAQARRARKARGRPRGSEGPMR